MQNSLQSLPPDLARHRVLNSAEAAAFCNYSLPHWRRLYAKGEVPSPLRLGTRKYGWKVGDLIDWIATKTGQAI